VGGQKTLQKAVFKGSKRICKIILKTKNQFLDFEFIHPKDIKILINKE